MRVVLVSTFVLVGLLAVLPGIKGLSCPPCGGFGPCEQPGCCESGSYTKDVCGCCDVCAKALGDTCGGPWNTQGYCNSGLKCYTQCECKATYISKRRGPQMKDCVFPFRFQGQQFNNCTTFKSENGKAWCATKVDKRGDVVDGKWGDCEEGCPGTEYPCTEGDLFNRDGSCIPQDQAPLNPNKYASEARDGVSQPRPAPLCSLQSEVKCKCARVPRGAQAQPGEGCVADFRGFGNGWCFLENVEDPSNPTASCYEDARWSPTNGKFYSSKACDGKPKLPEIASDPAGWNQPTTIPPIAVDPVGWNQPQNPEIAVDPVGWNQPQNPEIAVDPVGFNQPKPTIARDPVGFNQPRPTIARDPVGFNQPKPTIARDPVGFNQPKPTIARDPVGFNQPKPTVAMDPVGFNQPPPPPPPEGPAAPPAPPPPDVKIISPPGCVENC